MRWKFLLAVMLTAHLAGIMCVQAQSIFDPFGFRKRARESQENKEDEEENISFKIPGLEFLNFDFLNRGRQRERNRDNFRAERRNDKRVESPERQDSFEIPQPRLLPGPFHDSINEGKPSAVEESAENVDDAKNKQIYGPCGENNKFCQGSNFIKELGLTWSNRVHNGTGIFLRDSDDGGGKRYVLVGIELPNKKFGKCTTPDDEPGYCRHLEYCVQDEFRSDFIVFLQFMCDIPHLNQKYVGVCCPEEQMPESRAGVPTRSPPPDGRQRQLPFPLLPFLQRDATTQRSSPSRRRTTKQPRRRGEGSGVAPNSKNCGVSEVIMPRIVGGREADPKAWPWMAALLKKEDAVDYRAGQYCGGVLISEFHVLTAGHCVDGFEVDGLAVRIGEYDFSRTDEAVSKDINIADIFIHEEYNRYTYQNDIAIIKLERSAFFADRIKAICLPEEGKDDSLVNEKGIVTGFGTIYYGGPASDKLMEIMVPIWSQEECQAAYTQPIEETNLCAGVRAGSRDSCQGDSGGPLQAVRRGRWTTIGIVSWGIRCSEPGYPGVYTRVSKYIDWIASQMRR